MRSGTEVLRYRNRAVVLACLRTADSLPHTEIARRTGLASGTVSTITTELCDEGVLCKTNAAAPSGRGRPRVRFVFNPGFAYLAIVHVTGDCVEYSLVDYAGKLLDRYGVARRPDETDVNQFLEGVNSGLGRLALRGAIRHDQVKVISITTKGVVADTDARLIWSPVFEYQVVDFAAGLAQDWDAAVLLANETQVSALTVARNLLDKEQTDEVRHSVLSVGHSIGLGLAQRDDGGILRSRALSFGHMVHHADGPACRCGSRGCIEAFAGFYGVLRTAFDVPKSVIPAKFIPIEQLDRVANDARRGDRQARYAFRQAGEALGIGLSRLVSLYGNMSVTVTGRGIRYFDLFGYELGSQIADNLQVRVGQLPRIYVAEHENLLIFDGNVQASLAHLDETLVATKRLTHRGNP